MNSKNDISDESSSNDLALKTLLTVAAEVSPSLSEDLLRRLFLIQSRHQFDSDRAASAQEMQRIIEAEVASISEGK
jgi:hypothetical protein